MLQSAGIVFLVDYASSGVYYTDGRNGTTDLMQITCALFALQRNAGGAVGLSSPDRCVQSAC